MRVRRVHVRLGRKIVVTSRRRAEYMLFVVNVVVNVVVLKDQVVLRCSYRRKRMRGTPSRVREITRRRVSRERASARGRQETLMRRHY